MKTRIYQVLIFDRADLGGNSFIIVWRAGAQYTYGFEAAHYAATLSRVTRLLRAAATMKARFESDDMCISLTIPEASRG